MYLLGVFLNLFYLIYIFIKRKDIFDNLEDDIAKSIKFNIDKQKLYIYILIISWLPIIIYRIMDYKNV